MRRRKPTPGVITIDLRPFITAAQRVRSAFARMAHSLTPAGQLEARRVRLGGMATDARRWPDQWLSMECAGLICGLFPCPSDRHDLRCSCRCHKRSAVSTRVAR